MFLMHILFPNNVIIFNSNVNLSQALETVDDFGYCD